MSTRPTRLLLIFLAPLAALVHTVTARAECTLRADAELTGILPAGSSHRVTVRARYRVTLGASEAQVEAEAPLSFRGTVALSSLPLETTRSFLSAAVVGAGAGVTLVLNRVEQDIAIGALDNHDGLRVPEVRVACTSLSLGTHHEQASESAAPVPPFRSQANYISSTTAHSHNRCVRTRAGELSSCTTVADSPCQAIGDGSECGYHPANESQSVSIFAAPNARSPSLQVALSPDVVLMDQARVGSFILLQSRSPHSNALVVRGWVRREAVRWRQEVPAWLRTSALARFGVIGGALVAQPDVRVGWVSVPARTPVHDRDHQPWATLTEPLCVHAEQRRMDPWITVQLPNDSGDRLALSSANSLYFATISESAIRWVERCAPSAVAP
jgi:hypothetical protein